MAVPAASTAAATDAAAAADRAAAAVAVFSFPTTIVFGADTVRELPRRAAQLGLRRPLLVTDRGLLATPAYETVRGAMGEVPHLFADVQPNPDEANVRAAAEAFRDCGADGVIALGGGSALDVAKIIRLIATAPEKPLTELAWDREVGKLAPLVAIPTTAGTGSEVGRSAVVTIGSKKRVIFHPALLAELVMLDPTLTVDLPGRLTAATGADALTHCIESFTSPTFHPLCDAVALEGIRIIADALPLAVKQPRNLDARGRMQIAATMGGIAFQKDLGAAHSMAHPLSALAGIHHGTANALCLPVVMEFNAARKPGLYRRVGEALGLSNPRDAETIDRVLSLFDETGLSPGLRDAGVVDGQLDALADQACEDACHATNPVPVTRADLYALYRQAM